MTKEVKLQREGMAPAPDDPLVLKLAESWDKCGDELGNLGCDGCPVEKKCGRLWNKVVETVDHSLSLAEYRKLSQEFYFLKQERDRILASNGITPPSPDKPG